MILGVGKTKITLVTPLMTVGHSAVDAILYMT